MGLDKYNIRLRHFNKSIVDILLLRNGYRTIEEYEFESDYNAILYYHRTHNRFICEKPNNIKDNLFEIPFVYLNDETKKYFFDKYLFSYGFLSFDEYCIYNPNLIPYICIYISSKNTQYYKADTCPQYKNKVESLNEYYDNLFIIDPIINFSNLFCKTLKNKLLVKPYNINDDMKDRPHHYKTKVWNIFNMDIPFNSKLKGWIFPLRFKGDLEKNGVIFI